MAGRFLFQKLASRISESTGLLCARSSSRDLAPLTHHASEGGIGTLGRLFDGSCTHPCTVVPRSHEGCIRGLTDLFSGPSAHPSTLALKHYGVHNYAPKHLNSLPSFSPTAKMSNPMTGMPSHRTKPACLDSVRGVKRPFSSSSSDKGVVDWQAQKAIFLDDLEAKKAKFSKASYESQKAAIVAEFDALEVEWAADAKATREKLEALKEQLDKSSYEFNRSLSILVIAFIAVTALATYEVRWSPRARRGNKSQAAAALENPSVSRN